MKPVTKCFFAITALTAAMALAAAAQERPEASPSGDQKQKVPGLLKQWSSLKSRLKDRTAVFEKSEPVVKAKAAADEALVAWRNFPIRDPRMESHRKAVAAARGAIAAANKEGNEAKVADAEKKLAAAEAAQKNQPDYLALDKARQDAEAAIPKVKAELLANDPECKALRRQMDDLVQQLADIGRAPDKVTRVAVQKSAVAGQSEVTFDLRWENSWRAKWVEPADKNVTARELPVENWDAAWVFVKFKRPGNDGATHATLSTKTADHVVPAGATCSVGVTRDKGMGVFIYRDAVGKGTNDWRNIRLRWLNGADGVTDPSQAEVKVYAIEMVYVPQGAFALGSGGSEEGCFHRADDPAKPFLVTSEGPITTASKGEENLWGAGGIQNPDMRDPRILHKPVWGGVAPADGSVVAREFPKGYAAFYCMKYELSRTEYVAMLNSLPSAEAARRHITMVGSGNFHYPAFERAGVYVVNPEIRVCTWMSWDDGATFAAWAGLRPMSELEFEKAARGPRTPEPNEYPWGTWNLASMIGRNRNYMSEQEEQEIYDHIARVNAGKETMPRGSGFGYWGDMVLESHNPTGMMNLAPAQGASYWGVMDLGGSMWERVVTIGNTDGRKFQGTHGTGTAALPDDWPREDARSYALGSGDRGGDTLHPQKWTRVSCRKNATLHWGDGPHGWGTARAVRTAP